MRETMAQKGRSILAPEGRLANDQRMEQVLPSGDLAFEAGQVGGVAGWWCRPKGIDPRAAVLYLHGGAYVMGSAWSYHAFAGQIAALAGAAVFVVDLALAPEWPFPRAFDDARAAYDGLVGQGVDRIALCGDSAGGGLALSLHLAVSDSGVAPVAAAVMSPWIDLSLSGETMVTIADRDPVLSRETLAGAVRLYLAGADPNDPRGNALAGDFSAMPPVLIHAGADEMLLEDSTRFAALAEAAGRDCTVHVWAGMVHDYAVDQTLDAADRTRKHIGAFLRERLSVGRR